MASLFFYHLLIASMTPNGSHFQFMRFLISILDAEMSGFSVEDLAKSFTESDEDSPFIPLEADPERVEMLLRYHLRFAHKFVQSPELIHGVAHELTDREKAGFVEAFKTRQRRNPTPTPTKCWAVEISTKCSKHLRLYCLAKDRDEAIGRCLVHRVRILYKKDKLLRVVPVVGSQAKEQGFNLDLISEVMATEQMQMEEI